MTTMTIEEAGARLAEIIEKLSPGEEIVLLRDARPVARLIGQAGELPRPVRGRGRGKLVVVSEDDEHLEGFEECMP